MAIDKRILSIEEEQQLLAPIDAHVGGIQEKINALRRDGTDKVVALTNHMAIVRENANYTKGEKVNMIAADRQALAEAKAVEAKNKGQVNSLIDEAVGIIAEVLHEHHIGARQR